MTSNVSSWIAAYKEREDLTPFGSAGLALFAMALKFGYDDLETIGADAVVDGPDDKGCDVVYIDKDQRIAIVAQSYRAESTRASARDSKAATLRQGISYLSEVTMEEVPERLRASARALREAIQEGEISDIHIWFVHNCPSSSNVKKEMDAVKHSAHAMISTRFKDSKINIFVEEISDQTFERLYTETNTPILVSDVVEFDCDSVLEFHESEWRCIVVPLRLTLLQSLYRTHKTNLFSANVRDFLGVKASDSNINYQMQKSLKDRPGNFFVYNNGLTILTHKIDLIKKKNNKIKVIVNGLSIVNGAQTTGTIGNSADEPPGEAYVLARFISTVSEDLVSDVVRYNNSQNSVTASDFRSTDPIQRRLVEEMRAIPDAEYDGGRRGGVSSAIKRRPKLLPSYSVGQALAALHGAPTVAYNEKSAIWSRDALYSRFFNDGLSAVHIVFAYGLLRAIENEKQKLRRSDGDGKLLAAADKAKLAFYRKRGSVFLMAGAIGECLETIIDDVVANRFHLNFGGKVSPEKSVEIWSGAVEALSSLHSYLDNAFSDGLKNQERVAETMRVFSQLVAGLRGPYAAYFDPVKIAVRG